MTRVPFYIFITDDDVPEPDEDFRLIIRNNAKFLPNYIEIDRRITTITIINDDSNSKYAFCPWADLENILGGGEPNIVGIKVAQFNDYFELQLKASFPYTSCVS